MPGRMTRLSSGMYQVSTPNMVHAKSTTKEKAESQVRLLNAIDHGFKPTHNSNPYREENKRYGAGRKSKKRKTSGTGIPT